MQECNQRNENGLRHGYWEQYYENGGRHYKGYYINGQEDGYWESYYSTGGRHYKGYYIKEYFANYFLHQSDVTIDMQTGKMEVLNNSSEPWKITLLDTGLNTMTGGRVKRAQNFISNEPFMLTYGDGVSDINIDELVNFHKSHGKSMTMTSVQPEGRFGALNIDEENQVHEFKEKPKGDGNWINAGFFVCEPKVFDYITEGDSTIFEQAPLMNLARDGEIFTFKHKGFWSPMDSLKDKNDLNKLWDSDKAPWKTW